MTEQEMETLLADISKKPIKHDTRKYIEFKMDFDVASIVVVTSLN